MIRVSVDFIKQLNKQLRLQFIKTTKTR